MAGLPPRPLPVSNALEKGSSGASAAAAASAAAVRGAFSKLVVSPPRTAVISRRCGPIRSGGLPGPLTGQFPVSIAWPAAASAADASAATASAAAAAAAGADAAADAADAAAAGCGSALLLWQHDGSRALGFVEAMARTYLVPGIR